MEHLQSGVQLKKTGGDEKTSQPAMGFE
jgi:hypothetical protein